MTRIAHRSLFAATGLLLLAGTTSAQDPFAEGVRWTHGAGSGQPWIPSSVAFAARENLVWLGAPGGAGAVKLLDRAAYGAHSPRFEDSGVASGASHLKVAAGRRSDALFTLAQYPSPSATQRATRLTRHDPLAAAQGAGFAPVWTHDAGFLTNGPARMATDEVGELVVVAVWDNANSTVQIDWIDGTSGALASRALVPGAALNAVEMSGDGSTVAVSAGLDLYLFDGAGNQLQHLGLGSATVAVSLSGDGSSLALGGIGQLALLTRDQGVWSNTFNVLTAKNQIAARADLSSDGAILGIGWWNFATAVDARFEVWDLTTFTKENTLAIAGNQSGRQNMPEVVEVSADGRRVAFGSWGNGGAFPEVVVLAVGQAQPVFSVDTPGSVRDLDLDETGTRLLVAYKDTHNNVFSQTGGVLLYESGEQSISQLAPAATGDLLPVATRLPGASISFLLIGERAAPVTFPGVTGTLLLDRTKLQVHFATPQAGGRADFDVPIPSDPALIGVQLSMQPAWRTPRGTVIRPHVIDPLIIQ